MNVISVTDAQAQFMDIVHRLRNGEEIAVVEGDEVVAKIVGERTTIKQRPGPGLFRGKLQIISEDEEHLDDFRDYMP